MEYLGGLASGIKGRLEALPKLEDAAAAGEIAVRTQSSHATAVSLGRSVWTAAPRTLCASCRSASAMRSRTARWMMWREQPEDHGEVIVAVAGCLKDNNFRVCQGALSVLGTLVVEMGEEFRPYVATVRLRATAQLRYPPRAR